MKQIFHALYLCFVLYIPVCTAQEAKPLPRSSVAIVAPAQLMHTGLAGALMDALANESVAPRDGSVSVSLTVFDDNTAPRVLLNPTVLRDDTLTDVLGSLGVAVEIDKEVQYISSSCAMADAMMRAASLQPELVPDGVRHVFVIVDNLPRDDSAAAAALRVARDKVIHAHAVDAIHGLAVNAGSGSGAWNRDFLSANVVETKTALDFPSGWSTSTIVAPEQRNAAMVAETSFSPYQPYGSAAAQSLVNRMLARACHCWGDYDRDGDVDAADLSTFISDSAIVPTPPLYADWNFDNDWDGNDGPSSFTPPFFGVDYSKFVTGHNQGCP